MSDYISVALVVGAVVFIILLLVFTLSPLLWALGEWHCHWMPHVPMCRPPITYR